jgi:hypothetical protein
MSGFQPWDGWNAANYVPNEDPVGASLLAMAMVEFTAG